MHLAICNGITAGRTAWCHALIETFTRYPGCLIILHECSSGEALPEDAARYLLFLDIFMNGINGMDTAQRLRAAGLHTPVVFLTASPDLAVESYEPGRLLAPIRVRERKKLRERYFNYVFHSQREEGPL